MMHLQADCDINFAKPFSVVTACTLCIIFSRLFFIFMRIIWFSFTVEPNDNQIRWPLKVWICSGRLFLSYSLFISTTRRIYWAWHFNAFLLIPPSTMTSSAPSTCNGWFMTRIMECDHFLKVENIISAETCWCKFMWAAAFHTQYPQLIEKSVISQL